jgi:hypothetical protein
MTPGTERQRDLETNMNPTARLLYVSYDVTSTMTVKGINYGGDISKRFAQDLGMKLGSFQSLLSAIQTTINKDKRLPLLQPLNWKKLGGNPSTGETFSQYYLQRSINELVIALDWVMSHSPYTS